MSRKDNPEIFGLSNLEFVFGTQFACTNRDGRPHSMDTALWVDFSRDGARNDIVQFSVLNPTTQQWVLQFFSQADINELLAAQQKSGKDFESKSNELFGCVVNIDALNDLELFQSHPRGESFNPPYDDQQTIVSTDLLALQQSSDDDRNRILAEFLRRDIKNPVIGSLFFNGKLLPSTEIVRINELPYDQRRVALMELIGLSGIDQYRQFLRLCSSVPQGLTLTLNEKISSDFKGMLRGDMHTDFSVTESQFALTTYYRHAYIKIPTDNGIFELKLLGKMSQCVTYDGLHHSFKVDAPEDEFTHVLDVTSQDQSDLEGIKFPAAIDECLDSLEAAAGNSSLASNDLVIDNKFQLSDFTLKNFNLDLYRSQQLSVDIAHNNFIHKLNEVISSCQQDKPLTFEENRNALFQMVGKELIFFAQINGNLSISRDQFDCYVQDYCNCLKKLTPDFNLTSDQQGQFYEVLSKFYDQYHTDLLKVVAALDKPNECGFVILHINENWRETGLFRQSLLSGVDSTIKMNLEVLFNALAPVLKERLCAPLLEAQIDYTEWPNKFSITREQALAAGHEIAGRTKEIEAAATVVAIKNSLEEDVLVNLANYSNAHVLTIAFEIFKNDVSKRLLPEGKEEKLTQALSETVICLEEAQEAGVSAEEAVAYLDYQWEMKQEHREIDWSEAAVDSAIINKFYKLNQSRVTYRALNEKMFSLSAQLTECSLDIKQAKYFLQAQLILKKESIQGLELPDDFIAECVVATQLLKEDEARPPEKRRFLNSTHNTQAERLAAAITYSERSVYYTYLSKFQDFVVQPDDQEKRLQDAIKFLVETTLAGDRAKNNGNWAIKIGDQIKTFKKTPTEANSESNNITALVNQFYESLPQSFKDKGHEQEIKLWITEQYGSMFYPQMPTRVSQSVQSPVVIALTPDDSTKRTILFDEKNQSIIFEVAGNYQLKVEDKVSPIPVTMLTTLNFTEKNSLQERQSGRLAPMSELPECVQHGLCQRMPEQTNVPIRVIEKQPWFKTKSSDQYRSTAYRMAMKLQKTLDDYLSQSREASVFDRFRSKKSEKRGISAERRERAQMLLAMSKACIAQFNNNGELNEADAKAYLASFYQVLDEHESVDQHWYNRTDRFGDALRAALDDGLRPQFTSPASWEYRFSALGSLAVADQFDLLSKAETHPLAVQLRDNKNLSSGTGFIDFVDADGRDKYEQMLTNKIRVGQGLIADAVNRLWASDDPQQLASNYKSILKVLEKINGNSQLKNELSVTQFNNYVRLTSGLREIKSRLFSLMEMERSFKGLRVELQAFDYLLKYIDKCDSKIGGLPKKSQDEKRQDTIKQEIASQLASHFDRSTTIALIRQGFQELIESENKESAEPYYQQLEACLNQLPKFDLLISADITHLRDLLIKVKESQKIRFSVGPAPAPKTNQWVADELTKAMTLCFVENLGQPSLVVTTELSNSPLASEAGPAEEERGEAARDVSGSSSDDESVATSGTASPTRPGHDSKPPLEGGVGENPCSIFGPVTQQQHQQQQQQRLLEEAAVAHAQIP